MLACAGVSLTGSLAALRAQTSYPMITHVTPAAVQRGQTAEIEVFGQMDFAGAYRVIFEGAGLLPKSSHRQGNRRPIRP